MDSSKFSNYISVCQAVRDATQKFPKLQCRAKTACSTVVRRKVSRALPFVNHSAKRHSAMRRCVFFLCNFCDVVLVLFCDRTDLLK